jgi:hypothetical protein
MYLSGIDPTVTSTTAQYGLGDIGANTTSQGTKIYVYVRASGAITGAGYVVDISAPGFLAVQTTTTTAAPGTGTGKLVGVAPLAFANNDYGWVQVFGPASVRVSASAAAYTTLNTTATAGQIDDDATTGARRIDGIVLTTANGGAAATAAGVLNWPRIGLTI